MQQLWFPPSLAFHDAKQGAAARPGFGLAHTGLCLQSMEEFLHITSGETTEVTSHPELCLA